MHANHKRVAARLLPVLLALGAVATAAGLAGGAAIGATTGTSGPVRCEIKEIASGRTITLQGVVHTDTATDGSYTFRVTGGGGSGNTNIRQGGAFQARPGTPALLGQVMLGASGAIYDAQLQVTVAGKTIKCAETVGGNI